MKKVLIFFSVIITCAAIIIIYNKFIKRTPEKILERQFNIRLKDFDYSIEDFNEKWNHNGDGYCLIIFNFNKLTSKNIEYLQTISNNTLPITEQLAPNLISNRFLSSNGYYLYERMSDDIRDFKIFIISIENEEAILYYQIE